ncbi:hypothetical protein [Cellulophaga omnivescoria]|uniref:hypothetical protein n=1 Tax=Cellulophaga omnivescoria TaxID=1888890 RepID=UPI003EBA663E
MTFNEYLSLPSSNYQEISKYYLGFLEEFSAKKFPYEKKIQFKGSAIKFLNSIEDLTYLQKEKQEEYVKHIDMLNESLSIYDRRSKRSKILNLIFPPQSSYRVESEFEKIYEKTIDLINEANKNLKYRKVDLKINGFYEPENSNKAQIQKLILEAMELINEDNSLTEKTKKQLLDYLNKILKNLNSEYTNWTEIIGKIKETIIVLGALGGFIGGISPLFQAKEKLEQTTTVIEKTSINLNYKVINETFNHNEILNINPSNSYILQIENKDDKEEN